jgi:tripartite-type tricarboxylate transporter receptor subunit TctC
MGAILRVVFWVAAAVAGPAYAQYPDKPVRLIVAWPPGGGTDNAARIIAERLTQRFGQAVTVENRAGANGIIGTAVAAKAAPDGYTLLMATADTHSINPHVYKNLPYDAVKGFDPITLVGRLSFVLISRTNFEANTLQELIAIAKRKPNGISYGTWGIGSTAHVGMALFESAAGIDLLHVPFQGAGPATNALLGGQIDLYLAGANGAEQMRKAGRVKIFGVGSAQRAANWLPDVKTFAEQGLVGAESGSWYGIMTPAGVPQPIRDRLTHEIVGILKSPDVNQKLVSAGWDVVANQQSEFAAFMRTEYERYGGIVKSKGIQIEQPPGEQRK